MQQLSSAPQHSLAPEELTARTQETLRETECQTEAFKQQYVQAATQLVGVKVGLLGLSEVVTVQLLICKAGSFIAHKCMLQQRGWTPGTCLSTAPLNATLGYSPAADWEVTCQQHQVAGLFWQRHA